MVLHVGSHTGRGFDAVRTQIAEAISRVLDGSPASPCLVLENSAGGGGRIGTDFAEMRAIMRDLGDPPNLAVCVDTAHAFAAGYDLRQESGVDSLLGDLDDGPGLGSLAVLHVNDSKSDLGTHSDRHENIGAGRIGTEGFVKLLSRKEVGGLPLVLETPNLEKRMDDMAAIRAACGMPAEALRLYQHEPESRTPTHVSHDQGGYVMTHIHQFLFVPR